MSEDRWGIEFLYGRAAVSLLYERTSKGVVAAVVSGDSLFEWWLLRNTSISSCVPALTLLYDFGDCPQPAAPGIRGATADKCARARTRDMRIAQFLFEVGGTLEGRPVANGHR